MLKKTVTFDDLEGTEVSRDFYFNFNKLEIMEMELKTGGLEEKVKQLTETENGMEAYELFKWILLSAYGKKAPNGIDFYKKDPETGRPYADDLEASPALGEIILEFLNDPNAGAAFVQQCLPPKLVKEALAEQARLQEKSPEKLSSENISEMVAVAAERQADPETAVAPGMHLNENNELEELRTVAVEKKFDDYTREELLVLDDAEFSRLVPSRPTDMTREQLQIAMERKNRA